MLGKIRRLLKKRTFGSIQVEATSRCSLLCVMCPRTAHSDEWLVGDMGEEVFGRLSQAFELAAHVHLQGWGEPLLHPNLFEMASVAKAKGCRVGLTINGMLLDKERIGRIIH
jgi:MoaA/NifB/PqqE/SkfB family radical SAM enzyme